MKTKTLATLVGWVCAFAFACSQTGEREERAQPRSQAGAAFGFCTDFLEVVCQQLWRCGCGEPVLDVCEGHLERCTELRFFGALEDGLARGWLRYNEARAAALLARMSDAPDACDDQFVVLGFDSYTVLSFDGVFAGTLTPGAPCGEQADSKSIPSVSFCREGSICLPDAEGVNRCVVVAAPGDPCPLFPNHPGSSCLERRPADPDGTFRSAEVDLACVPDGSGGGTCQRDAPDGTACDHHTQCASRFCWKSQADAPGACAPRLPNGDACEDPAACETGRCDFTRDPPTCSERNPAGAECLFGEDCESLTCAFEDTAEGSGICGERMAPLAPGSACGATDTCAGGLCADGMCLPPICTYYAP
jgi:hypothetical protein